MACLAVALFLFLYFPLHAFATKGITLGMSSQLRMEVGLNVRTVFLELSRRGASDTEVKRAYRKLSLELHPDKVKARNGDAKAAEELFQQINRAYQVLSSKRTTSCRASVALAASPSQPIRKTQSHAACDYAGRYASATPCRWLGVA